MTNPRPRSAPRPAIVIDEAQLPHLEALADGAMARMPEMADRLLTELSRARVVASGKLPADVVAIGRAVTWRDESTGKEQTATLVWPEEADIAQGRISVATPIGVALIGLPAGARFSWATRGGEERDLTVLSVG
ncbi:MAG: nucleoside diphosphate kinase regulator [Rubellimicrobium sp.]|nr:nucleoside diphosphate kinase regulator [Rubellimicrobium sp.]